MNTEQRTTGNDAFDIKNDYVIINNRRILFREQSIIDGKLHMTMPSDLKKMPVEPIAAEFSDEAMPDVFFMNAQETMTMFFSFREEMIDNESIKEATNILLQDFFESNPSFEFISSTVFDAAGTAVGCFDLSSYSDDIEIYSLMFIFPFEGRLVFGSFNYSCENMTGWDDVAKQMISSINIVDNRASN